MLKRFSVFDLVIISLVAGLGIATKPFVYVLANIITGPLTIPTGTVAGAIYMLWLVLGAGLTGKRGTSILIGLVQALLVMVTGMVGSHGVMTIFTYTVPGLAMELGLLAHPGYVDDYASAFVGGMLANAAGTVLTSILLYSLPLTPLVFVAAVAALTGGLGGIIAYKLIAVINVYRQGVKGNEA